MGYFTILAAIPGFFLSSFITMLLLWCYCPELRHRKNRLSHGHVDNYHPLACRGTSGGGWSKSKKVTTLFLAKVTSTTGGKAD